MAVLAIDFDGVLMDPRPEHKAPGHVMGPPMPGAVEAMAVLDGLGHTLIVHTCRAATDINHVEKWLTYFGIPFAEVTAIKPYAQVYLDDQAVRFTHWKRAYADIVKRLG